MATKPSSSASATAAAGSSLKEYLKRYQSDAGSSKTKRKKKPKTPATGILLVDEDVVWQKPVAMDEEPESAGEDEPKVEEDIEVKRMRRLEAIRAKRGYHDIAEDGSGWISLSETDKVESSVPRRARNDTPSPERETNHVRAGPSSPQRIARHDSEEPKDVDASDADLSPPRKRPSVSLDDLSPQRKRHSVLEDDLSPPRRVRNISDDDMSPPRRRVNVSSDDLSPPRRASTLAGRRGSTPADDLSPPRKGKNSTVKESKGRATSENVRSVGLLTMEEVKEDNRKHREKEKEMFSSMDPSLIGKDAKPVFRDKQGRRIAEEDIRKDEKPKEKKLEWGKGLAQKREAEARALELEMEKQKPFARTRDDPELDEMLKSRIRWGDPMAHLVKVKNPEEHLQDFGMDEKIKESGFIVPQHVPNHSWIKRKLDYPPNRYGIRPGRHWDRVDRSNGFEKELFKHQNEKRAVEQEAYLWSVAEM